MSHQEPKRENPEENVHPLSFVSRRSFLKGSSAVVAAGAATLGGVAIGHEHASAQSATPMPGMAGTPTATLPDLSQQRAVLFFTPDQAKTVDAIVSRIMPGSADDPGAHEAGVVFYIDRQLSGANLGYDLKTYTLGPFLVTSDAPIPVEAASSRDIYASVLVDTADVSRYGFQSSLSPQEMYRRGLTGVDAYSQKQFQKNFVDLTSDQQDSILTDMAGGKATEFDAPTGAGFFAQLRNDTIEGMFSDPMYGGNAGTVGWLLVGYPGAQMEYTPDDIANPNFSRQPQTLAQMLAAEGN